MCVDPARLNSLAKPRPTKSSVGTSRDLDGSLITYIYLDGIEADKQQVGTGYQSSLLLTEKSQITDGKHKVAAVQYKENDPSGEIVFFRSADFTVKKN